MDGDSDHLAVNDLALARVQAGTDCDAQLLHRLGDRAGAADRARRPVKAREETVARRVHFDAAIAKQFATDELVMLLKKIAPPPISETCRVFAGGDNVGEEHGRKHAIGSDVQVRGGVPRAFEERVHLAEIGLGLRERRDISVPVQFDIGRARDAIRNETSFLARNLSIVSVLQDERRDADRWQHITDVD